MGVYRNWFLASRPWSFSMTFISVSVASAMAAWEGIFSWPLYAVTMITMILVHAATNLINDYYDVLHEVDSHKASTAQYRPHPLLEGKIAPAHVRKACIFLYPLFSFHLVTFIDKKNMWGRGLQI
jgi:1,4-dihydroxy-2-naphthoate octaprenyltransferase